jgi:hypothetical protein
MIYSTANVTSILFPSAAERRRTASDYPVRISGRRGRCIVRCKSQRIKGSGPKENFGGKLLIRGRQARTSSRKIHAGGRGGVTTRGATGTRSPLPFPIGQHRPRDVRFSSMNAEIDPTMSSDRTLQGECFDDCRRLRATVRRFVRSPAGTGGECPSSKFDRALALVT